MALRQRQGHALVEVVVLLSPAPEAVREPIDGVVVPPRRGPHARDSLPDPGPSSASQADSADGGFSTQACRHFAPPSPFPMAILHIRKWGAAECHCGPRLAPPAHLQHAADERLVRHGVPVLRRRGGEVGRLRHAAVAGAARGTARGDGQEVDVVEAEALGGPGGQRVAPGGSARAVPRPWPTAALKRMLGC